jgi:hypothetical protein
MEVVQTPLTTSVVCICCAVWFWLWNRRVDAEAVGVSFRKVVHDREYWRVVTATFAHLDIMHLVFNVWGLWSCRHVELLHGSLYYLQNTIVLMVRSCARVRVVCHRRAPVCVCVSGSRHALKLPLPLPPLPAGALLDHRPQLAVFSHLLLWPLRVRAR